MSTIGDACSVRRWRERGSRVVTTRIPSLRPLVDGLTRDPWRERESFSSDLLRAHETLWDPGISLSAKTRALTDWLSTSQPCLFGRMAARAGLLSVAVLPEEVIDKPIVELRDLLQAHRREFLSRALAGASHGIVLLLNSREVAEATPASGTLQIAQMLASLYLLEDVDIDRIHLEHVYLRIPGSPDRAVRWRAGVNYFCSQGDQRWWHDHRIPGGMALSINSVGHMVKSDTLSKQLDDMYACLGLPAAAGPQRGRASSLDLAHQLAMRTIKNASTQPISGRATALNARPPEQAEFPGIAPDLLGFDARQYSGYYHTDVTLPADYFRDAVDRPADVVAKPLDFSYLIDASPENYDYLTTGVGVLLGDSDTTRSSVDKMTGTVVSSEEDDMLRVIFGTRDESSP